MSVHTNITAARPALSDGWIEHDGAGCPLPYEARVFVRLSDGSEDRKATFAGFWSSHGRNRWKRCHDWHITHYRIAAAVPVNLPARIDAIAARRAA